LYSHLIFSFLISASASTVSASKDYLSKDPILAGSIIKYCEINNPKICTTIDRRKEKKFDAESADIISQVSTKLGGVAADFSSLSIKFDGIDFSFDFKQENPKK
jgi:hypothetical protein